MVKKKVIVKKKIPRSKHKKDSRPSDAPVGYKKPPHHKGIKKGEVRNPKGISASLEVRTLRATTTQTLAIMIQKIIVLKPSEVKALLANKNTTAIEAIVLGTILDAIQHRNYNKLEQLLERVIGKVPDKVDMTTKNTTLTISKEDSEKLRNVVKEINKELEDEY